MKICIRKNTFFFAVLLLGIIMFVIYINSLLGNPRTTKTRASEEENFNSIIGGTKASIKDWSFTVALLKKGANYSVSEHQNDERLIASDLQFCAGSVIGSRWIITAAHCLFNMKPEDVQVIYNQDELNKPLAELRSTVVDVEKIIPATYDIDTLTPLVKMRNDIALLKLSREIPINQVDYARTVITNNVMGTKVKTAGWGWDVIDDIKFIKVTYLKEVSLTLTAVDEDSLQLWYIPPAHAKTKGFCHGDSGGPLIIIRDGQPYLIGVVSYTTASCGYGYTFTNVGLHADWIELVVSGKSSAKLFE